MFLSGISPLDGLHELDFRFEVFPEAEGFFFAHHGATLNELMKVCGLASLGSTFYIVDMAYPLRLPEVVGNERLFKTTTVSSRRRSTADIFGWIPRRWPGSSRTPQRTRTWTAP
jgi:hypothetical protein